MLSIWTQPAAYGEAAASGFVPEANNGAGRLLAASAATPVVGCRSGLAAGCGCSATGVTTEAGAWLALGTAGIWNEVSSVMPDSAARKSRMPFPSARPASGRRFGPRKISATSRMKIRCVG